jgi:hypothetical protein
MSDSSSAFLGGVALASLIIALTDDDFTRMGSTRSRWNSLPRRVRATMLRSYGRNIMKTIVSTPRNLKNQRSQARKLVSKLQRAHDLDRSVVGRAAVSEARSLMTRLRNARGYSPVSVSTINIS